MRIGRPSLLPTSTAECKLEIGNSGLSTFVGLLNGGSSRSTRSLSRASGNNVGNVSSTSSAVADTVEPVITDVGGAWIVSKDTAGSVVAVPAVPPLSLHEATSTTTNSASTAR